MTTPLDRPLRRAVLIDGEPYVATLSAEGVKLTGKGRRKGVEVSWSQILTGEVALHSQLAASLEHPNGKGQVEDSDRPPGRSTAARSAEADPQEPGAAQQARRPRPRVRL
jgi:hypothetical protein